MGDIKPGYVFSAGETVTPEKLNQLVFQATLKPIRIESVEGLRDGLDSKIDARTFRDEIKLKSEVKHKHTPDDVVSLQEALDAKERAPHRHVIEQIDGLETALANKSNNTHGHTVANVNNLSETLQVFDNKLQSLSTAQVELSNVAIAVKQSHDKALLDKADIGHTHTIEQVKGLQGELDQKASASHTHHLSELTDLAISLQRKTAKRHKHNIGDIVGFTDTGYSYNIEDRVCGPYDMRANTIPTVRAIKGVVRWIFGIRPEYTENTYKRSSENGLPILDKKILHPAVSTAHKEYLL